MNKRIMTIAVSLLGYCYTCCGQDFNIGVASGPFFDMSSATVGHSANFEFGYKLNSRLHLVYEYLYANNNNKVNSYGNPLFDGLGEQKQLFGNGLTVRFTLKKRGKYEPYIGLGGLYSKEKFNIKTALANNSVIERAGNEPVYGIVPSFGVKYYSDKKVELCISLKGIITENAKALQLSLGLGIPF